MLEGGGKAPHADRLVGVRQERRVCAHAWPADPRWPKPSRMQRTQRETASLQSPDVPEFERCRSLVVLLRRSPVHRRQDPHGCDAWLYAPVASRFKGNPNIQRADPIRVAKPTRAHCVQQPVAHPNVPRAGAWTPPCAALHGLSSPYRRAPCGFRGARLVSRPAPPGHARFKLAPKVEQPAASCRGRVQARGVGLSLTPSRTGSLVIAPRSHRPILSGRSGWQGRPDGCHRSVRAAIPRMQQANAWQRERSPPRPSRRCRR